MCVCAPYIFSYIHQERYLRIFTTAFDTVDLFFLEPFSSINFYDLIPLFFLFPHSFFSISFAGFFMSSYSSYSLKVGIPYLSVLLSSVVSLEDLNESHALPLTSCKLHPERQSYVQTSYSIFLLASLGV